MKRKLITALSLLMVFSLAGCTSSDEPKEEEKEEIVETTEGEKTEEKEPVDFENPGFNTEGLTSFVAESGNYAVYYKDLEGYTLDETTSVGDFTYMHDETFSSVIITSLSSSFLDIDTFDEDAIITALDASGLDYELDNYEKVMIGEYEAVVTYYTVVEVIGDQEFTLKGEMSYIFTEGTAAIAVVTYAEGTDEEVVDNLRSVLDTLVIK